MKIDELERLLAEATQGTWGAEEEEATGRGKKWHMVAVWYGPVVCRTGTTDMPRAAEDAALIAAARNALPALLRVARAAQKWHAAQREYEAWHEDESRPASDGDGIVEEMDAAHAALSAALAALEGTADA
jgi:hypothetical protein